MVSTDPTVSLSAMFGQPIGGRDRVPIRHVPKLCGLNINPNDAKGVFQQRLNSVIGQMTGAFGGDVVSTPCAEEMATFDQFVSFLEEPDGEVIVFDTAPTGKSLRELAMPFDWAGFLQRQIQEGKKLAEMMNVDEGSFEELKRDRRRYDRALNVLRNRESTVFSLVLLPERLPIEETQSAITFAGADRLMSRWTPAWATAPTSRTCWCAPIVGRRGSAPGCWPPQRSWPDSKGTCGSDWVSPSATTALALCMSDGDTETPVWVSTNMTWLIPREMAMGRRGKRPTSI